MKTKPLTFLLSLTFLFLFSGSSVVFSDDLQDATDAYKRQDYETAYQLNLLLADQGIAAAQYNLGVMVAKGEGITQDINLAINLFRLAAEQGFARAQYDLGVIYDKPHGVPQDYKKAVKWFRLAAEQGHTGGQYNLGLMYYNGHGVPQDDVLAHMWWNICSSSGRKDCVKNRTIVEEIMTPSQREKAQEMARNWKPTKK